MTAADLADPLERERLIGRDREPRAVGRDPRQQRRLRRRRATSPPATPIGTCAMVRLNVEAVVDLMGRVPPGMVAAWPRRDHQHRLDRCLPAPARSGHLRGDQGLRPLASARRCGPSWRGSGVTVTALCPGPVRTEFVEAAGLGDVEDRTPDGSGCPPRTSPARRVSGAERGKRVVVPGPLNRAAAVAGQHAPRALALPLVQPALVSRLSSMPTARGTRGRAQLGGASARARRSRSCTRPRRPRPPWRPGRARSPRRAAARRL